jgi:hypothetical protein
MVNMKNSAIVKAVSRSVHKVGFKFKKHSPEILLATGIVGTVASTVMACKATTKISTILDETKATVDASHECVENPEMADQYTVEDSKKDLAIVYAQTGLKFAKLYGPSVLLGAASVGCILASHNIISNRNAALSAAYAGIFNDYKGYRNRVVERFGKELDQELKYNIKSEVIEEETVDEKGKKKKVKKTIRTVDPSNVSEYARFFDETALGWDKDAEYNLTFLLQQQSYFNDLLKSRGYVYLNEVYEALGIDHSKAGQIVGWVYDEENPVGDNYIDFGIHDLYDDQKRLFVNGKERSILLDFNVDGNILDLM